LRKRKLKLEADEAEKKQRLAASGFPIGTVRGGTGA